MPKSPNVEIEVVVHSETMSAILVEFGGKSKVWVPKSQISDWCDGPDDAPGIGTTSIFIPQFLAEEKGMV